MRLLLAIAIWCMLLVLCPALAVAVIVLYPVVWLLSLPLRLVGICFDAAFALLKALLFLPARLLRAVPAA